MFRLLGAFLVFIFAIMICLDLFITRTDDKVAKMVKFSRRITEFIAIRLMNSQRIIVSIISKIAGQSAHKLAVNVNGSLPSCNYR